MANEAPPPRHHREPPVQAALDELRGELGSSRIELGVLATLGAHTKVAQLRAQRDDTAGRRRRLADRIRRRDIPADRAVAEAVRRACWARP